MALTWGTIVAGVAIIFGLPAAIFALNRVRRNYGWWLLIGLVTLVLIGNLIEMSLSG